jgi:hypothetical protein
MNANDGRLPPPVKWPSGVRLPISPTANNTKTNESSDLTEASATSLKKSPDKEGEVSFAAALSCVFPC